MEKKPKKANEQADAATSDREMHDKIAHTYRAFLRFGADPKKNINIITELAGEMLHGACALYNRLDNGQLCAFGQWNAPPGFQPEDNPEGHICYDVIKAGSDTPVIIHNLHQTPYAQSDVNVQKYQLRTYIGKAVRIGNRYQGSLCVVYQKDYQPTETDLEILGILTQAIAIEDQRWQSDEALRQSEEQFRVIFHNQLTGLLMIDAATHVIVDANTAALSLIGSGKEHVIGKACHTCICPAERGRCPVTDLGQSVDNSERILINAKNERIPVLKSVNTIELGGKPYLIESFIDITERKALQEAVQQANRKLNLLSSITRHDIINQLTVLTGYIRISHGYLDDKNTLVKFLEKADKAATIIEHHIRFTGEYEEMGVNAPAWQNVHEIVKKAMAGLHLGDIKVDVDRTDLQIFADPLCGKVFYNLIDNALRYGGESMKTIRFSSQESGTGLIILCEDDGVGIADDVKKRLFTRGFGKNTGLGLFLSREILSITGITITENGTEGKGARFEITVPNGNFRFTGI